MGRNLPALLDAPIVDVADLQQEDEFTEPCMWYGCESTSTWVWRCRVCGSSCFLCAPHDVAMASDQLPDGTPAKGWFCMHCHTRVSRWPSLFRRLPL